MTSTIPRAALHQDGLLLLPAPHDTSFPALRADYGHAICEALAGVHKTSRSSDQPATLDIVIALELPQSEGVLHRSTLFPGLQRLLSNIYKLVGLAAVQAGTNLDIPGGVDVTVLFLAEGSDFPSLRQVVASGRSWNLLWTLNSSGATAMAQTLVEAGRVGRDAVHTVQTPYDKNSVPLSSIDSHHSAQALPHYSVAVGGTFDHLHIGHKLLLSAVWLALDPYPPLGTRRLITVGITGGELLVNKKFAEVLEPWERRWQACWSYYETILDFAPREASAAGSRSIQRVDEPGANGKYVLVDALPDLQIKFMRISDPYGPTITDENITALVVSGETRAGGQAVNDKREERGWRDLKIFEVDVLDLEEDVAEASRERFESKISSTEVRRQMMEVTKGSL